MTMTVMTAIFSQSLKLSSSPSTQTEQLPAPQQWHLLPSAWRSALLSSSDTTSAISQTWQANMQRLDLGSALQN